MPHNYTITTAPPQDDVVNTLVAVAFAVSSAVANSLGLVMQKWAHNKARLLWVFGNLIFQMGSLLMAGGLIFGSQMLLSPIGALVLVFNIPFALCLLKERASPWDLLGSLLIMIGVAGVAVFGPASDAKPDPKHLMDLFLRPAFLTVFCFLMGYTVVVGVSAHFVQRCALPPQKPEAAVPLTESYTDDEKSHQREQPATNLCRPSFIWNTLTS